MKKIPRLPDYAIDESGNVFSLRTNRKLSPWKKNGYWAVSIWDWDKQLNGKEYVHRLLLETFVSPPPPMAHCRHLNGDKLDNRLENLRWGTRRENVEDAKRLHEYRRGERHGMSKLKEANIRAIRKLIALGVMHKEIAKKFGVFKSTISHIATRNTWGWLDSQEEHL